MPLGSYVVVDLETTGLDPQYEGIVEVAAVRLDGAQVVGTYQSLVNPGIPISEGSFAIHGIDAAMLVGAPDVRTALNAFLAFLGDTPIVAHNASFDVGFLNKALAKAGRPMLTNPVIDTLQMSREVFPDVRSHRLEAICRILGHEAQGFHRALDDASHLAAVFPRLVELFNQRQAWYRAQFAHIEVIARRYDQVSRLIEGLQGEMGDIRRILTQYFTEDPTRRVPLRGGDALVWASRDQHDYDLEALWPRLEAFDLKDRFVKLDRQRLERWLAGSRLDEAQRASISGTRVWIGSHGRIARESELQDT